MDLVKNFYAVRLILSPILVVTLVSCAATQTAIEHRNLAVSTKMSETVYLEPVNDSRKTVFVAIKNTSDEAMDINPQIRKALSEKGYKVVSNPQHAYYLLQGNILQIGKMSVSASKQILGGGFGSALMGAGTGATLGALTGNDNAVLGGGLAGGLVGLAADSLVKAVNYTMVTDVQISERAGKGVKVQEQFDASLTIVTALINFFKNEDYMRLIMAIFLPFLLFFTIKKPGAGIICLILQLTVIGWLPAALWAVYSLSQYNTDRKLSGLNNR